MSNEKKPAFDPPIYDDVFFEALEEFGKPDKDKNMRIECEPPENTDFYPIKEYKKIHLNEVSLNPQTGHIGISFYDLSNKEEDSKMKGKIKDVKIVALDFDGVLTDNTVIVDENGHESAVCNRADGMAIAMLKKAGIEVVVITSEKNPIALHRCKKLGIPIMRHNGRTTKGEILQEFADGIGIDMKDVVFVGNDVNDISALEVCGHPIVVWDATRLFIYKWNQLIDLGVVPHDKLTISTFRGGTGIVQMIATAIFEEWDNWR